MRLILELACESEEERQEARAYADSLRQAIERSQHQGLPDVVMSRGDSAIWVAGVELEEGP